MARPAAAGGLLVNPTTDHDAHGGTTSTATPHSPDRRCRVLVVMPAYNAARTLADTWAGISHDVVDEVLLVDDRSHDATLEVASRLPIRTIGLPHNVGYGGNQKTCYLEALRLGAEIVVMLHPDGQYDPAVLPDLIAPIQRNEADLVLGSRMMVPGGARAGHMPMYRYVSNKALTAIENQMLRTHFSELHTGYRAYSRSFLETVPFLRNSNDFVFDSQIIAQAVAFNQRIVEVPIQTRYFPEASSTSMRANIRYGFATLWTTARYRLHTARLVPCRLFVE
jgi:glycosyltransferase involved in cell wall biosynthesis